MFPSRAAPSCLLVSALGGLIVVSVLVYAILAAFKSPGESFGAGTSWWPEEFQWGNITKPFEIAPFGTYFLNSTFVGVSVTVLNIITCTAAGYSFSKFRYPGRGAAFIVVLATLMVPLEVLYVPLYKLVFDLGLGEQLRRADRAGGDERVRHLPDEAVDRLGPG